MTSRTMSYIRRIGLAAAAAGVALASITSVVSASATPAVPTVAITSPSVGSVDVYVAPDGSLVGDQATGRFLATFPAYTGEGITFQWPAYPFKAGVNGAYHVELWQNMTPQGPATWVEQRTEDDFANNPAGTTFTMGPFFEDQNVCQLCPSVFVVQPETYQFQYGNLVYGPLMEALPAAGPEGALMRSAEFVFDGLPGRTGTSVHDQQPVP